MKQKMLTCLAVLFASFLAFSGLNTADAQNGGTITVSGQVVDSNGDPLMGAGVLVKGTTSGVVTDIDGRYSISVGADRTLVFSYIGFTSQEVAINGNPVINCTLAEDQNLLDDVVVVGYGTQNRKSLTTSVSKVDGDKLVDAPVSNVGDALKGKVPGLRIQTSNSLAGESPRIMIRGGSSISMGNDPIYVVDGMLRPDLNGINTNDIESMTVLKDAASASIYGARASNGVILITTRKGSASKGPQIVFDVQMGVAQPERRWDLLNAREQISLVRPAIAKTYANSTGTLAASAWLDGANVAVGAGNYSEKNFFTTQYLPYGGVVPDGYQWMADPVDPTRVIMFTDRDNQAEWLKDAFWRKEYIGINGGNDKITYAASVSHMKDDGVVAMSAYDVITAHGSTSFKITDRLQATTTFDLSRQKKNPLTSNYFNAFGRGIMLAPTVRAYNSNGDWVQGAANANHEIATYYEAFYDREAATNRSSINFNLKWNIIDGLDLVGQYSFFDNNYRGSYYAPGSVDGHSAIIATDRSTTETRTQTTRDTFTAYLAYNKTLGGAHGISATAGWEYMTQRYWYLTANSTGSVSDDVPMIQSGINFSASNKDETQALMSFYGRAQYDYKNRYIASVTARYDGSSKFARGNRWGFFPAGSLAWVISEEPFMDQFKTATAMNNLKIRLSYGQTGNNGIGLYDTYGSFATGLYNGTTTYVPGDMQNMGLRWESTTQFDLGLDLGFAQDRYRLILDYYNKVTDNMLFDITLPDTCPYASVSANVGSARFYGFEVELGAEIIRKKNFSWNMDFTYSFTRNKVLSLPEDYGYDEVDENGNLTGNRAFRIGGYKMTESGYRFGGTAVGEPLGRIYGYKIDHIIQTEAEAEAALYDASSKGHRISDGLSITGRKDAGDYEWCNRKGSAKNLDGQDIINAEDMFYLGSVVPHSTGGFNNTFRYKGLTFSVYFDYAIGHSIYNYMKTRMIQNTIANSNSSIGRYVYDCWQYPGDTDAKYARYFPNDGDYGNANWGRCSDFNVERADYLCLRDVTLMYDLPSKWTDALNMKKVTVGVSGNTLHYFTGVTGAINPETGIGSGESSSMYSSVSTADGAGNIFPATRKILFNVKITF